MKKLINIVYSVLFLLIVFVPLVTTNIKENIVSDIDNRRLMDIPKFGEIGFTKNAESFLRDRIGGRKQMINTYTQLNNIIADELTHPTYTYGQDGYVFFNTRNNTKFNDYHKTFCEMVLKVQNYCEARGTNFYLIFDPEKSSVYSRYLPKGYNYDDSWVAEMMSYMDELGINYVNNIELLKKMSYSDSVFNKKYDAGHWNDRGCFYATNALLELIHQDISEVQPLTMDMFNITSKIVTTLPNSDFRIKEEVPVFSLKSSYTDVTNDWIDEVKTNSRFPHFHYYINDASNAKNLPKTLIFQGSYYNKCPQFLVSATSEDIGVHNYQNILELDYYYNIFQPKVVIFDVAQYVLDDTYFDTAKMKTMDFNPVIINYNDSFDEQLEQLKQNATYIPINTVANVFQGNNIDEVSVDIKISDTKYAYIISDKKVIDLKKSNDGLYTASVIYESISQQSDIILYIEEQNGNKLYLDVDVKKITNLTEDLKASQGALINNNIITFSTTLKNNKFNSVNMQLINLETNEYIMSINNRESIGNVKNTYIHKLETGWYKIRLKANSSLQDEYVDSVVYLLNEETYNYSFNVDKLSSDSIIINGYKCHGYCGNLSKIVQLSDELEATKGISIKNNEVIVKTDINDNKFDSIDLQLINIKTNEYIMRINNISSIGCVQNIYMHELDSGWYKLRLKANSNLQDEYIDSVVYLQNGEVYFYIFNVNELSPSSVLLGDYKCYGNCGQTKEVIELSGKVESTKGVLIKNGIITVTTEINNNIFNAVDLQLINAETNEYIMRICSMSTVGSMKNIYMHELESGWYKLRLKTNSNIQDEYVDTIVYLVKGEAYYYTYSVDKLLNGFAIISNYKCYEYIK